MKLAVIGKEVFRDVLVPGAAAPAPLGLRHGERPIQFASIFVRDP